MNIVGHLKSNGILSYASNMVFMDDSC